MSDEHPAKCVSGKTFHERCINKRFENIIKDQITLNEHSVNVTGRTFPVRWQNQSVYMRDALTA